jgi:hypothetical protein
MLSKKVEFLILPSPISLDSFDFSIKAYFHLGLKPLKNSKDIRLLS